MQGLVDHPDILQEILIRVAKSSDGAKDFARAISVCKAFRSLVDDRKTLRAVSFERLEIDGRWELFQIIGGLICRCAKAGQQEAQFIMGKIILKSTAQMLIALRDVHQNKGSSSSTQAKDASLPKETTDVILFVHSFVPGPTFPDYIGYHVDFVKIFLSQARLHELEKMELSLSLYMNYFMLRKGANSEQRKAIIKDSMYILKSACLFEDPMILFSAMVSGVRDMFLVFSKALQKSGVEKEKLGCIELDLDVNAQTTVVEKLDMGLKLLSDAQAIKERLHQLLQHSSKQKNEVTRGIQLELETFDFGSMKDNLEAFRAKVSDCLETRRNLLSKFRTFFL